MSANLRKGGGGGGGGVDDFPILGWSSCLTVPETDIDIAPTKFSNVKSLFVLNFALSSFIMMHLIVKGREQYSFLKCVKRLL